MTSGVTGMSLMPFCVDVGAASSFFSTSRPQCGMVGFGADVIESSRCRGPMRIIACIEEQDVAKKILSHLGLPTEPLPTARAQAPPVTLKLFPAA